MCVRTFESFLQCNHVATKLTSCPSYHKQQESAKGFLGSIFKRDVKKMKHCGKLVPHPFETNTYCHKCTVKNERYQARRVGEGAYRVHRPVVEESFRDERQHAAKESLRKSERSRRGKKRHHHEVVSAKPSVWLPDLYDHPETLARKEAYARAAAPAPPVSSRPPKSSSRTHESPHSSHSKDTRSTKQAREARLNKSYSHGRHMAAPGVLSGSPDRTPAFGTSQPLTRPAEPKPAYQYSGRFANNSAGPPPACGLPPAPPRPIQRGANNHARTRPELRSQETCPRYVAPTPAPPIPEYQRYLNAMSAAANAPGPTHEQKMARLLEKHAPNGRQLDPRYRYARVEPPKAKKTQKGMLSNFLAKQRLSHKASVDSDLSFVCADARAISNQPRLGYNRA
ncbi:hypothetical protein F5Y15DRAFT_206571 [Xylariaceae sp. FL0016]|nr:hypothetical protein F5Y15DRAFT_206571 [Xylariaceae sp. FL0016]